tara:strand:+ start:2565 stop:3431 length:867 start_codon:yes stop_codon:yes gene_type:complete
MKVAGVTFIRNAEKFAYPIKEAILSILPICDELVVAVGKSEDKTLEIIQHIDSDKIQIIQTVWDDTIRTGGQVLAIETNKALDAVSNDIDWCFYIQADEAIHEKYLSNVRKAMQDNLNNKNIDGLLFHYKHFWGNYDYIGNSRKWYRKEVRIIRNNKKIRSYKDAQGFRKNNLKLNVKQVDAYIYHYGWVRPPEKLQLKNLEANKLWHSDDWISKNVPKGSEFDFSNIDSLEKFDGTHPEAMAKLISTINWHFNPPPNRLGTKERISRWIEKLTNYRLGEYKNYNLSK